jgi:ribose-phosphate pyrophosphokinase
MHLIAGSANRPLAHAIAVQLGAEVVPTTIEHFEDSEVYVNIQADIAGQTVAVVQSCNAPTNEHLMELLILLDAAKRQSPKKLIAVVPFLAYRRQIEKHEVGESVTAELVARLIEAAGADQVVVTDLHDPIIASFFTIPVRETTAFGALAGVLVELGQQGAVVVAPDEGATERSRQLADHLGIGMVQMRKHRGVHDVVSSIVLDGDVAGKDVVIMDDEVNTGGTLIKVVATLKEHGAQRAWFACTHPVLSGNASHRIQQSAIDRLITTDTIDLSADKLVDKISRVSVAGEIAVALREIA